MNKLNKILRGLVAVAVIFSVAGLQSCKSDDEELFEKYFNMESNMQMSYGEVRELDVVTGIDDDAMVVPNILTNLSIEIANTQILEYDRYDNTLKAISLGETEVSFYNGDKLVKTCKVTVNPPYELKDLPEKLQLPINTTYSLFKETDLNSNLLGYVSCSTGILYTYLKYEGSIKTLSKPGTCELTISYNYGGTWKEVKKIQLEVVPTATIDLKCGDVIPLKDYVSENLLDETFRSSDVEVANIFNGNVCAYGPGIAEITSSNSFIKVNVEKVDTPQPFPIPWTPGYSHMATLDQVKEGMKEYQLEWEGYEEYNMKGYTAFRYKLNGSATATYYMTVKPWDQSAYDLNFIVVRSDKTSKEVYGWMLSNLTFQKGYYEAPVCFFIGRYQAWDIYPENGSWNNVIIMTSSTNI